MSRSSRLAGLVTALLATQAASADSLSQVYERARQNDPQLREADANRLALREAKPQARGALLPQISGTVNLTNDESDVSSVGTRNSVIPVETATNGRSDKLDWRVELRQTVFRWDQWVRFRQADKQVLQADVDYRVAELNLFTRVAEAYFDVLAAEDTLASNVAAREAIGRQLEQAQKRFEVGLIAITDVQEAQSGYDQAVASEIVAKRSLATSKEVLREIIGDYPGDLAKPKAEIPLVSPAPADENQWVEIALQQNYSLQSAQLGSAIARDNVRIARSGHLPTVDFVASHTDNRQNGEQDITAPVAIDNGVSDLDIEADAIALQVAVPVYSGGTTNSRVRQAVYQHRAAKERLERTARQTERQTRDAYLAVNSEISRVRALQQALKSAQTALQATEAGFEVGTRTTVDVLDARRQLFQAETNYARSRYDYIVNVFRLKEAAGTLAETDLAEINAWLQEIAPAPASP
jgi:outer membrane protein